jgi:spore coat protein U-like protein
VSVKLLLAAALVIGMAPAVGHAASTCNFSVSPVAFGTYSPALATPDDSAGTVTITCTNRPPPGFVDISYVVRLGRGQAGTFATRQMVTGAALLGYNLFLDAARTIVWGDGTAGTGVAATSFRLAGNKTQSISHTIYGRIPARQAAQVGSYTDTIVVTLEF